MLNYQSGYWKIEVAKDCVTGEIDAFIWNKSNDEGWYYLLDEAEELRGQDIPASILDQAKEMLNNVEKVMGGVQ